MTSSGGREFPGEVGEDVSEFGQVDSKYLLLTFIPFFEDDRGRVWLERLWHHDFVRHVEYLKDLTLLASRKEWTEDAKDLVLVDLDETARVRFVALPSQETAATALLNVPRTFCVMWREIRRAQIVQSGVAGWPFPVGWIANPIALFMRRHLVLVIESSPWRITTPGPHRLKRRIMAWLGERLARYFAHRASLVVATHSSYLETLRRPDSRGEGFVNPASWIDENDVIDGVACESIWSAKIASASPRMIFAGRLTTEKGVELLLDAVSLLRQRGVQIHLDVIGDGPLRARCADMAGENTAMRLLEPVPYGREFYYLLRAYHAVLVPSLSDEQPRILFDAFSQAAPVIGARTVGIVDHVDGRTGWTFDVGSIGGLADAMQVAAADAALCAEKGRAARAVALRMTHRAMHKVRSQVLCRLFEAATER